MDQASAVPKGEDILELSFLHWGEAQEEECVIWEWRGCRERLLVDPAGESGKGRNKIPGNRAQPAVSCDMFVT